MARVVIIGGSSGIGLAVARRAAEEGFDVLVVSRNPERADVRAGKAALDITDAGAVVSFFRNLGPIDHLVSSTLDRASGPAKELDLEAARRAFEAKLWGPWAAIQAADVRKSITLLSGGAASMPMRGGAATAAVNGAVEALVRTLAIELRPVRVNAVAPGTIETPAWDSMPIDARQLWFESEAARLPVGRVGRPEDVAAAVLLLMRNGFITGTILHVDGGNQLGQA